MLHYTLHMAHLCATGAVGALYGPLHGGANEAVLRMLERIGKVENIPKFIEGVKNRKEKMFGFGHRCLGLCLSGLKCCHSKFEPLHASKEPVASTQAAGDKYVNQMVDVTLI